MASSKWRSLMAVTTVSVGGLAAWLMQSSYGTGTVGRISVGAKQFLHTKIFGLEPRHPSRLYAPTVTPSLLAVLKENQYSLQTKPLENKSIVCRVDVNSIASNEPIEDRHSEYAVRLGGANGPLAYMIGVYDGHAGKECAHTLRTELPIYCLQSLVKNGSVIKETAAVKSALEAAFQQLDNDLMSVALDAKNGYRSETLLPAITGSVATQAVIINNQVYVANTGDVRAVLGRKSSADKYEAVPMSRDHHAEDPEERQRVLSEHPQSEKGDVLRHNRILGGLQPTRAFGDCRYKWTVEQINRVIENARGLDQSDVYRLEAPPNYKTPPYVTARPDLFHRQLTANDEFLIVASDGLWDWVSNEEAVEIVRQYLHSSQADPEDPLKEMNAATFLISKALQNVPQTNSKGKPNPEAANPLQFASKLLSVPPPYSRRYRDDITVAVVLFHSASRDNNGAEKELPLITEIPSGSWDTRIDAIKAKL